MASKSYKKAGGLRKACAQVNGNNTAPPNMQLERKVSMKGSKKGR